MNFLSANEPFAISALVILLGYALKRTGVLRENDGEALARAALNITLPSVILLNLPGVPIDAANILLPFFGFLMPAAMVLSALFFFRRLPRMNKGLPMMASSGYNIGLFAIPMVMGLYGSAGSYLPILQP
jgi:predicted permease